MKKKSKKMFYCGIRKSSCTQYFRVWLDIKNNFCLYKIHKYRGKKIEVMIWIILGVFIDSYFELCFSFHTRFFVAAERERESPTVDCEYCLNVLYNFFSAWCIRLEIKLSWSLVWDNSFSFFDLTYEIIQFVERFVKATIVGMYHWIMI